MKKVLKFGPDDLLGRWAFEKWFYLHVEYQNSFLFKYKPVTCFCNSTNKAVFQAYDKQIGINRFTYVENKLGEDKVEIEWTIEAAK